MKTSHFYPKLAALILAGMPASARAENYYETILKEFNAANTVINVPSVAGAWEGRCFSPSGAAPVVFSMILGRQVLTPSVDPGPFFKDTPENRLYQVYIFSNGNNDKRYYTKDLVRTTLANYAGVISTFNETDKTELVSMYGNSNSAYRFAVRKGTDGYLYATHSGAYNPSNSASASIPNVYACYFWEHYTSLNPTSSSR